MPDTIAARTAFWNDALQTIVGEWSLLSAAERDWVAVRVAEIAALQRRLQQLVDAADGAASCRACAGGCCGHGTFHLTLANVLAHLVRETALPVPDFTRSCPWIGPRGCRFAPELRPFNCITFNCEAIDDRLPATEYAGLERRLRELYTAFDRRYHGSSLRGLFNDATPRHVPWLARRTAAA